MSPQKRILKQTYSNGDLRLQTVSVIWQAEGRWKSARKFFLNIIFLLTLIKK